MNNHYLVTAENVSEKAVKELLTTNGDHVITTGRSGSITNIDVWSNRSNNEIADDVWSLNGGAYCEVEDFPEEELPDEDEWNFILD